MTYNLTIQTDDIEDVELFSGLIKLVEKREGVSFTSSEVNALYELIIYIADNLPDDPMDIYRITIDVSEQTHTWQSVFKTMRRIEKKVLSAIEYAEKNHL